MLVSVPTPVLGEVGVMMTERTWEIQDSKGDAALIDPGPTFDRTNDEYKAKARKALDFDPGPMREDKN